MDDSALNRVLVIILASFAIFVFVLLDYADDDDDTYYGGGGYGGDTYEQRSVRSSDNRGGGFHFGK